VDALSGELLELRLQVVAEQHGDFQTDPGLVAGGLQGGGTGFRIDSARVADHANLLFDQLRQQQREHFDKIPGEPGLWVLHAGAGHDRHRDLGQVIEHQIIQAPACHELGSGGWCHPRMRWRIRCERSWAW
jgi:hypothetical protein